MPRAVFRSNEVEYVNNRVILEAPFPEQVEEAAPENELSELAEPAYMGPTADELRREAEKFKQDFEKEKLQMMDVARSQSEAIVQDGRSQAAAVLAETQIKADELTAKTNADSAAQKEQAADDVKKMLAAAETDAEAKRKQGYDEGFEKGRGEGFTQGRSKSTGLSKESTGFWNGCRINVPTCSKKRNSRSSTWCCSLRERSSNQ